MGVGRRRLLLVSNDRPDHLHTRMAAHETGERGTWYSFDIIASGIVASLFTAPIAVGLTVLGIRAIM